MSRFSREKTPMKESHMPQFRRVAFSHGSYFCTFVVVGFWTSSSSTIIPQVPIRKHKRDDKSGLTVPTRNTRMYLYLENNSSSRISSLFYTHMHAMVLRKTKQHNVNNIAIARSREHAILVLLRLCTSHDFVDGS